MGERSMRKKAEQNKKKGVKEVEKMTTNEKKEYRNKREKNKLKKETKLMEMMHVCITGCLGDVS